jgi:hypothetical protein
VSNDLPDPVERIERRFRRRGNYGAHAVVYGFSAILIILFVRDPDPVRRMVTLPNIGDLLLILIVWTVIFAAHSIRFYMHEAAERAILRQDGGEKRKPKRHFDRLALAEDGELLVDLLDDDEHEDRAGIEQG